MSALHSFEENLKMRRLMVPGEKVFVACSGGPDSVALFHLLRSLAHSWKLKIGLLHLNHRLRGRDSDQDATFVKKLARDNQVPLYLEAKKLDRLRKKEKWSPEEAARSLRYDFFVRTAKHRRISKIALAHTQDDQAETVLMRILQGTGLRGLLGIREKLKLGNVTFVRPLLPFSKKEILNYLKENKIPFREDKTNRSLEFPRNRIRLKLFPQLARQFNPRVIEAIARIPSIAAQESELLQEVERISWKRLVNRRTPKKITLKRNLFLKFPPALQFRMLEQGLRKLDPKSGLGFDAWQRLRAGLERGRCRYSLPRDIDLSLTPSRLMIYKKFAKKPRQVIN